MTVGGTAFADYTDILECDDLGGGPNVITFEGYGAAAPVLINLGNLKQARKFTLTREHTTDTLAEAWRQSAIATWTGVATVVVTHMDYSGTETSWTVTNAKVELAVPQRIGMTTITKITITGGNS